MTIGKRRLDDYFEELPPTAQPPVLTIPDSCSEASDDDEPKAIPPPIAGPSRNHRAEVFQTPFASGSVRNSILGRPQGPLHPKASLTPNVQATTGRNGRVQYAVEVAPQEGSYYAVQCTVRTFSKSSTPRHWLGWKNSDDLETWDGDAYIRITGNRCVLLSEEGGDQMAMASFEGGPPDSGTPLRIGTYDIEVDRPVTYEEFTKATCILNKNSSAKTLPTAYAPATFPKSFKTPTMIKPARQMGGYIPARPTDENDMIVSDFSGPTRQPDRDVKPYLPIAQKSFYGAPAKKEIAAKIVIGEKSAKNRESWGGAVFDPEEKGAVVMRRPKKEEAKARGTEINDVVLEPLLSAKMRDHQKEGVKFMYACVMKLTEAESNGCILADEMGLGKTLQTIALIHMLLRQSPFRNQSSIIGKALIVCPVGLCDNWRKEFKKWVRSTDIGVIVADGSDDQISTFLHYRSQHVLIIGYEKLRKHIKKLASCQPPIDLIVCDEGHRLKTKDNKTTKMFEALRTTRRIILSGTPVQNDLGEYWAMVDFCCPGLLGTYKQFFKHYEKPITKSREVGASAAVVADGKTKAEELSKLSKEFVLRRTADVLKNYLPPKHEYVLFVAPSELQIKVYNSILSPNLAQKLIKGTAGIQGLAMIDLLRKVSNTPLLLRKKDNEGQKSGEIGNATEAALEVIPKNLNMRDVSVSGKLSLLDKMLFDIHATTQEKVVVVSNWTATLDIIQNVCNQRSYAYMRLDGSTAAKERQPLVDAFNRETRDQSYVFLLSAKAGGVGLNLIGASRLILFDSDWNPSTDLQAMARIHRDGQKKPVFIYRLLTTNTIDEKIYQRQITKTGLSDQMLDQKQNKDSKDSFSPAELKDIFTLRMTTDGCQTHDLLQCDCRTKSEDDILAERDANLGSSPEKGGDSDSDDEDAKKGFVNASQYDPAPTTKMLKKQAVEQQQKLAALKSWTHYDGFDLGSFKTVHDTILYNTMWHQYDSSDAPVSSPVIPGIEDVSESEWDVVGPKKKKAKLDPDEDDDEHADRVMDSADEGSDSVSDSTPKKKKGKKVVPANSRRPMGMSQDAKRYSLAKIAKAGGTGRVMFAFEKVSQSKLLPSREGSAEDAK